MISSVFSGGDPMVHILILFFISISVLFAFLFIRERRGIVPVRVGRRGDSVLAIEIPYNDEKDVLMTIARGIMDISTYRSLLVCSGVQDKPPNSNIADRDYYIGTLTEEEVAKFRIDSRFDDISIFLLNEEVKDREKILLTHDLIVHSAQIPDRELLLDSGFILTVIAKSNLLIVTGVKGVIERVVFALFEFFSQKEKRLLISKM